MAAQVGFHQNLRDRRVYDRGMEGSRDVTVFVLAGGKSTRMGRDKAFIEYEGRPLLGRALNLGRSLAADVRIVGSAEKFGAYGAVVEDIFRDCGPLGGIQAALLVSHTDLNLMLAVDMPFLSLPLLQYLIGKARDSQAVVTIPRSDGRLQPLSAIYRRAFAGIAENSLRASNNKIGALFAKVETQVIEEKELVRAGFSSAEFRNLNTPQDLQDVSTQT
jgi:molybdenum cofactor guanylyltransferase